jgi:hypothetical protein
MLGHSRKRRVGKPYVASIRPNEWRIVVPIRGRLSPHVLAESFPSRSAAEEWLNTPAAASEIAIWCSGAATADFHHVD